MNERDIETEKQAMFEVWCWQHSNTHSFNNMLFDLFMKADQGNLLDLFSSFPKLGLAWSKWYHSDNPDKLLEEVEDAKET